MTTLQAANAMMAAAENPGSAGVQFLQLDRTYRGSIEIDREQWKLSVSSEGWNEEATSDQPEYEVNTEPLGRCPICEDFDVVETPTHFSCAERLKEQTEPEPPPEKGKKRKKRKS